MRSRVFASLVLAGALALGTSGCNLMAPQTTTKHYDASDGVSGDVGTVKVRNALVVADEDGSIGNLVVTLVNTDDSSHAVTISWGDDEDSSVQVVVDAGSSTTYSVPDTSNNDGIDQAIEIDPLDVEPGALVDVFFQYGTETGLTLEVPVLDGTLESYSTLVPSGPVEGDAE